MVNNTVVRRLEGRRVVVTGGGSGIGRAGAIRLAEEGAGVAVTDKRLDLAEETADLIEKAGGRALAIKCDVGSDSDVKQMTEFAAKGLGGLDSLFATAGTAWLGWIHETTLSDWEQVIRVNLTGTFLAVKYAIPHMLEQGGGAVVTTGSIASVVVGAGGSAASYAASKGGVLMLTKQVAVDYGEQGIRANCICPGAVTTNLGKHAGEDRAEFGSGLSDRMPRSPIKPALARAADPKELGGVVTFLISDDASYITGSAIMVDGGYTAI